MIIILGSRVSLNSIEVFHKVGVRVRKTVRKVLNIVIMIKDVREGKCVVVSRKAKVITLVVILIVRNAFANTMPAHAQRFFDLIRKGQDFHSVVV